MTDTAALRTAGDREWTDAGLVLFLADDARDVTLAIDARVITVFLMVSGPVVSSSFSLSSSSVTEGCGVGEGEGDCGVYLESGRSLGVFGARVASLARVF